VVNFIDSLNIVPILSCVDTYAIEKARLRKLGKPVEEFDLLIGCSATTNNMVLVTNNEKHFLNITGIVIENWTL
jgi:tRNA(fMet)-specific endonuclease VapC